MHLSNPVQPVKYWSAKTLRLEIDIFHSYHITIYICNGCTEKLGLTIFEEKKETVVLCSTLSATALVEGTVKVGQSPINCKYC